MKEAERELGRRIRQEVLGASYVREARSPGGPLAAKKDITEFVWSKVWGRPGLSRQKRSIANIALLIALNRPRELRIHVAGALNNGLTHEEEISEIILQCAAYCGMPAARTALSAVHEGFELYRASRTDKS